MVQNSLSNWKTSISEILYLVFFAAMFFCKGMGFYEGQWPFDILIAVSCLTFLSKIILTDYSLIEMIVVVLLVTLGFATYYVSGEMGALLNIMIVAGIKKVPQKHIFKLAVFIWAGTFLFQMLFSLSGLNQWQIFRIHQKMGHYVVRWSLGYTHPNVLHVSYFVLIALIFYIIRPKGRKLWQMTAAFALGSCFIFLYSVSYTGMLLVMAYLLLNLYFSNCDTIGKTGHIVSTLIPPAAIIFSVAGPVLFKGKLFILFDHALSTRFTLSRYFLTTQQIGLFGTKNFKLPDQSYNIDCSYVYALMHYGIIYFALFVCLSCFIVPCLLRKKKYIETAIVLGCLIAGITEPFLANTSFKNLTMIFAGEMLFTWLDKFSQKNINPIAVINREFTVNRSRTASLMINAGKVLNKYRTVMMTVMLCSMVLGGLLYTLNSTKPDNIYATLWNCDRKSGDAADDYVYLDINNLPAHFNGWILSYQDAQTPLYSYDGFTVKYEYIRRILGHAAALGLFNGIILLLFLMEYTYRNENIDARKLEN